MPATIRVVELARYLGASSRKVQIFAREHGLLFMKGNGTARRGVWCVTDEGAMRIIAVFRVVQGREYAKGKQYHEVREKALIASRCATARNSHQQERENTALSDNRRLLIDIFGAHTEAESAERSGGKDDSVIAETAVVCMK